MGKKCNTGFICLANTTIILIIIVLLYIFYFLFKNTSTSSKEQPINLYNLPNYAYNNLPNYAYNNLPNYAYNNLPNYAYNNLPGDVYLNPYVPPLKDERYLVPNIPPGTLPINVSTNLGAVDTAYRQVGILTPLNGVLQGKILPLMGRPLFVNRNKWQYYGISDQNNSVKLPIIKGGRSCTNEYGCDQLYNSDTVYVEGYGQAFKITIYDNDTIKYIPFI
jgi:hypothetical protein